MCQITLQEWITKARDSNSSNETFLELAVDVSLILTNRLCQAVGMASIDVNEKNNQDELLSSSKSIRLTDIVAENVIISSPRKEYCEGSTYNTLSIDAVDIQPRRNPANGKSVQSLPSHYDGGSLNSRNLCHALGRILLEIFSKGRSRSHSLTIDDILSEVRVTSQQMNRHEGGKLAPNRKRNASWITEDEDSDSSRNSEFKKSKSPGGLYMNSKSRSSIIRNLIRDFEVPFSICRLVSDLLNLDHTSDICSGSALASLEAAQFDLIQMKYHPKSFLFDRACPEKALEDMNIFRTSNNKLYGRDREIDSLLSAAERISLHVSSPSVLDESQLDGRKRYKSPKCNEYSCEATFLSGRPGSGKSRLIHYVMDSCRENGWFVINCKFDNQMASLMTLAKSFDEFFESFTKKSKDSPNLPTVGEKDSFDQVMRMISAFINGQGLLRYSEIIPNLHHFLHSFQNEIDEKSKRSRQRDKKKEYCKNNSDASHNLNISTPIANKLGCGRNRLLYFFQLLIKSICCGNRPVLIVLDDLQWADPLTLDVIWHFTHSHTESLITPSSADSFTRGLYILGSFRHNEVARDSVLMRQLELMEADRNINVTTISIEEWAMPDINRMLSFSLCLPMRRTQELAELVYRKTGGNPLFVKELLKSLIESKLLEFSVKPCRWVWDTESIDLRVRSRDMTDFLTNKIHNLPQDKIKTLKIASCFGCQLEVSIMSHLNFGQSQFDVSNAFDFAVIEGLMKRKGSTYEFSHDIVKQVVYDLMCSDERKRLHKGIGLDLIKYSNTTNHNLSWVHSLAVDQVNNVSKDDGILTSDECLLFAEANLVAGKRAMNLSDFRQAHLYVEAGISLLGPNCWDTQYSLSLKLQNTSVLISFIDGNVSNLSNRLNSILAHARSFEDSLTASELLSKLLASSGRHLEAITNCLSILSCLGENFPEEIQLSHVMSEVAEMKSVLKDATKDRFLQLPEMVDKSKLKAMTFLSLSCSFAKTCKPMLLPLLSSRMVKMTLHHGFCDESIFGLVKVGLGLINFTDDIQLAYRIGDIAESLTRGKPNGNFLRVKMSMLLFMYLKPFVDPLHAIKEQAIDSYRSGLSTGDVECAMSSLHFYFISSFYVGADLRMIENIFPCFGQQMCEYKQVQPLYAIMSCYHLCTALSGRKGFNNQKRMVDLISYEKLYEMGQKTNSSPLLWQLHIGQVCIKFWFRDFLAVVTLGEKYRFVKPKRFLEIIRVFFEGIAALYLARVTEEDEMRDIGEKSITTITYWAKHSPWNFENKLFLLKAELHNLNHENDLAETAYEAAITSARNHCLIHEEGLGHELYGIFCLENTMPDKALEQLQVAQQKYVQWGALKKAHTVKLLINRVESKKTTML